MRKTKIIIIITLTALATIIIIVLPWYLFQLGLQIGYAIALWAGFLMVSVLSFIVGYKLKTLNPTSD